MALTFLCINHRIKYDCHAERGKSLENDKSLDRAYDQKKNYVQMQNMGGGTFRRPSSGPMRNVPPFTPSPEMPSEGTPQMFRRDEPRTAPPNFIPEPPRGERFGQNGQGPEGRSQFGVSPGQGRFEREDFNRKRRELRGCIRRFTFVWLFSGESFWFYPVDVDNVFVRGFRWRRNRWVFDRIFIRRIIFFRCF